MKLFFQFIIHLRLQLPVAIRKENNSYNTVCVVSLNKKKSDNKESDVLIYINIVIRHAYVLYTSSLGREMADVGEAVVLGVEHERSELVHHLQNEVN